MNRRKFMEQNGLLAGYAVFLPGGLSGLLSPDKAVLPVKKPNWLVQLIHMNDGNVENLRFKRITNPEDPGYGGISDAYGMASAHAVTSFLKSGICALATEESKFYNNESLSKELLAAAEYLKKVQHEDGTIDLLSTNFHSTPDTGFIVKWLCPTYHLLERGQVPQKEALMTALAGFLKNAGKALVTGGIHTPNHRWVVCAALAGLYRIWPEQAYLERAETWLAEGIDLDEDGQYEEKSSYIYSSLSNRVLISTARGFAGKEYLLDEVRKNLDMTFYYLHPNGEIVTEASGRQDNSIVGHLERYYYPYRYMALLDNNGYYAAACRLVEETAFPKVVGDIQYFLEDPALWEELPARKPLPTDYSKKFPNSGLIRIRRGDYDASILLNNAVFFTFHKGNAVLQGVRLAAAFFGKGQFVSEDFKEKGGEVILERSLEGPYYQPFPKEKIPGDGDWSKMPRSQRAQSEVQKLKTLVKIREIPEGFELEIDIRGTDHVPVALELIFRPGGSFSKVEQHESMDKVYFLKSDEGRYTCGGDTIVFGPGQHGHEWVEIRGGLPRMDAPTVFLTGSTPFHHKLKVS
ncbi:hypothetical protein [Negadavirga shengliensis]|uniref:Heparinase II/III-like protein n=1 Tax=Negadavirga shengliensis TaxID=1389218 RepID=A0ABV9T4I9_9BACT